MKHLVWAVFVALMVLAGCDKQVSWQNNPQGPLAPGDQGAYLNDQTVGDDATSGRGATDMAMEYADKCAKLSQQLIYAQKRLGEMETDNKKLQGQIDTLNQDLARTKKELGDANAMLDKMAEDLRNWRTNVLGFRKDILEGQTALLTSQKKILELLGAEVPPPDMQAATHPADSTKAKE